MVHSAVSSQKESVGVNVRVSSRLSWHCCPGDSHSPAHPSHPGREKWLKMDRLIVLHLCCFKSEFLQNIVVSDAREHCCATGRGERGGPERESQAEESHCRCDVV